jgi:MFS superfamily sulfate permease-like transporter
MVVVVVVVVFVFVVVTFAAAVSAAVLVDCCCHTAPSSAADFGEYDEDDCDSDYVEAYCCFPSLLLFLWLPYPTPPPNLLRRANKKKLS